MQIMNQVMETERRSQARLIDARKEAQALSRYPELLKLRKLEALRTMAASGARFIVGLDMEEITRSLSEER